MDQVFINRLKQLEERIRTDDIFTAYADSIRELGPRFEEIVRTLPPQEREVLTGYGDCMKLMQLRLQTLVCEQMDFIK